MKYRIVTLVLIITLVSGMIPLIIFPTVVKAIPATLHVPTEFTTITDAIGNASAGDTILVDAGTYNEAIDVNKQLNITSTDGASLTYIDGTGLTLASAGLVKITANGDVTFSGFTIQNAPADGGGVIIGILSQSSVSGVIYTISYNNIYGTNDSNNADDYGFYSQSDSADVVFTHNLITQTGANNIVFELHTGATEISYNTLDAGVYGSDAVFIMTYNGIDVTALQNVSYNTFNMSTGGPFDYDHRSSAISFNTWPITPDAKFTDVTIQGNTINNLASNRRGIGFWNGGGSGGGTITPLVDNNTITGTSGSDESYGIDFIGAYAATNASITNNEVSNCDYGIYLRTAGCAPGAEIYYNNIVGNIMGLDNLAGPLVDAQYNWWGDLTGPYNPTTNSLGMGDPVTDYVNFSHYLKSPVGARLYVDPTPVNKAPADVGTDFTVAILLSNFSYLAGLDINLTWDNSIITFVNVDITSLDILWGSGQWAVVNESWGAGYYDLAATALNTSANNTGASVLFNVTFHAAMSWTSALSTPIHFAIVKLSDDTTPVPSPIPASATDGTYVMSIMEPGLVFKVEKWNKETGDNTTVDSPYRFESRDYFHINIYVSNVGGLANYSFTLEFTTEFGAFQGVEYWGIFGAGNVDYTPGATTIAVDGSGSAWSGSEGLLCKLTFYVNFTVTPDHIWKYGNANNAILPVSITNATLGFESLGILPMGEIAVPSAMSIQVDFVRGDLNCDGAVTMLDIGEVAYYYGQAVPPAPTQYDLNNDSIIDIYDIVTIATNYLYGTDP